MSVAPIAAWEPSLFAYKTMGGGCTQVSRPVNRKTGAPEGAPRTATIFNIRQKVPDMSMKRYAPIDPGY